MQQRLLIRADGGKELGFGHWSRCLFLASCYSSNQPASDIFLFTKQAVAFLQAYPQSGIRVQEIREEEEFFRALRKRDIVLLDGYDFTADYFSQLYQKGILLLYVDDLLKAGLQADIILNHSLGVNPSDYRSAALYTSFYLGSRYSMVPERFKGNSQTEEQAKKVGRLLLCMGGADPSNATACLLEQYSLSLARFEKVYVVLGPQYAFEEEIRERWGPLPNFQILKGIPQESIRQLMQECGSALLPASTMAVEYVHVGGVLGIFQTADNQERLFQGLLSEGVAVELSTFFQENDRAALYAQLVGKQAKAFDGLSQERFRKLFSEMVTQQKLRLRVAHQEDASLTYQWATDQKIRAFSFSGEKISWEGHQQWFRRKVAEGNCFYLIAEVEETPVGSIRFDLKGGEAVISYLIDSRWHGKGLGRMILAEGIKQLQKSSLPFSALVGFVMQENGASRRIFERMGFEEEAEDGSIRYFKNVRHE